MKRWRKVIWTFLFAATACLAFGVWAKTTRSGLLFEKDQYWRQILDNSPYVTKNIGPGGKFMRACQIIESGTLRGLRMNQQNSGPPLLGGEIIETWHGPCYVEIQFSGERKIIWGNKLTKVEYPPSHSVHVNIE